MDVRRSAAHFGHVAVHHMLDGCAITLVLELYMRTGIEKVKLLAAEVSLNGDDQRLGDVDLSVTAPELQCSPLGPRDRGHDILLHYEIDPVTDLPSRTGSLALLDAVINQAQNFGHQIGVALVDLDDFQVITEAAGHTCAKDLLRAVGKRLLGARAGVFVGYLGGDRFLVFSPLTAGTGARPLAEELVYSLLTPFVVGNFVRAITVSIGTCNFPRDGVKAATLVVNAEAALSRAKFAGRDCVRAFQSEMIHAIRRRALLEPGLRQAIAKGELSVFYQPQFDCGTGAMSGTEALLRWNHPELGPISPAEFIPIAERSNLIVELGSWVLMRACKDTMAIAARSGCALKVAVNVSMRQFNDPRFPEVVRHALEVTGLLPENLELEITESVLAQDIEESAHSMKAISDMGVQLSIDDFGTGYSSLSYLQRLPIKKLKLDRSFIHPLTDKKKILAQAVFSLARACGLTVVAEGVEEVEEYEWLCHAGCDQVQGYLVGRPMPLTALETILANPPANSRNAT
jgi:diguanylate cyclase (GGDEF)-like protein